MPNVQLPDGRVVAFPDSMSESDINSTIATELGASTVKPQASASAEPTGVQRALGLYGVPIARGLASTISSGNDLLDMALPDSQKSNMGKIGNSLIDKASAYLGLDATPQSPGERYGKAAATGVGSALPFVLAPEAAVPSLIAGAAGGLGGQAGSDLTNGSALGTLAGGLVGGAGVQGIRSLFAGKALENVAKQMGDASSWQEAGEAVQQHARSWLGQMSDKIDSIWQPIHDAIPDSTPATLGSTINTMQSIAGTGGRLSPALDTLQSTLPAKLLDKVTSALMPASGEAESTTGTITRMPGGGSSITQSGNQLPPTWGEVRSLRSAIGDALADPKIAKSKDETNLRALYASITDDLGKTAEGLGQGQNFADANSQESALHGFAESQLGKIVAGANPTSTDPLAGKVASQLLNSGKKDGSQLLALRNAMPEAVDNLAAGLLRTDPQSWAKLSPEAKAALIPDQATRAIVEQAAPIANKASNPISTLAHGGSSIAGGLTGYRAGELLGHAFGWNPEVTGNALSLGAGAAPYLWRAGKSVLSNPLQAKLPAAGLLGANALMP